MEKQMKKTLFVITFTVILYASVMNLEAILSILQGIGQLVFPIFLGMIFAFILSVPMKGFENLFNRYFSYWKKKPSGSIIRVASLILTWICILLVIALAATLVIPELIKSLQSIFTLIQHKIPELVSYIQVSFKDLSIISKWVETINWEQLTNNTGVLLGSTVDFVSSTASSVINVFIAIVISIYILMSKKNLPRQAKNVIKANLSKRSGKRLYQSAILIHATFTKFLSGQCVEAILLGLLIFVAYTLLGLPYAGLIGFMTGLSAFIPYIGAISAALLGAFLTLLVSPEQVILGLITHFVIQFIENQLIYPHVVGTSVGLSPLWTLIGALIGGKLFGLPGIIFFIPLVAVVYQLVRDNTNQKLIKKGFLQNET